MSATAVSFYAYKGGVGRTMMAANAAVMLARWGFRALCIDWDLEAPGLHRYFERWMHPSHKPGIVELIAAFEKKERPDWRKYAERLAIPAARGELSFIRAAVQNDSYAARSKYRNLSALYEKAGFDQFLEDLLEEWKGSCDVILIDAPAGITDVGSICTVVLPDILVSIYTSTRQTLDGAADIARRSIEARYELPRDRAALLVVPIFGRAELAESDKHRQWVRLAAERMRPFYGDWASPMSPVEDLVEVTRMPYEPVWAFGESLAVLDAEPRPSGYVEAIETLSALLAQRCADSADLLANRHDYVARASAVSAGPAIAPPKFDHDVFVSYSSEDLDFARRMSEALISEGLSVFFAQRSIVAGESFPERLEQALLRSRHLLVVLGKTVHEWQLAEIVEFYSRRAAKGGGQILPLLLPGAVIDDALWFIRRFQTTPVDASMNTGVVAETIASAVHLHNAKAPRGAQGLG